MEDISRLEHKLVEASDSLKQGNEANSSYGEKLARSEADREIIKAKVTELERRERERSAEMAKQKEALERYVNRVSVLEVESSELRSEKATIEVELDKTIEGTLVLLGQSFD